MMNAERFFSHVAAYVRCKARWLLDLILASCEPHGLERLAFQHAVLMLSGAGTVLRCFPKARRHPLTS